MAETLGTSGAAEWEEDLRDTVETSDDLFSQYEQTDDLEFLREAIALAESAVTSITPFHPNQAILSAKLRKMWRSKFEHTEDEVDLDMAWVWAIEEIGATPKNMTTYATACSSILTIRCQLESTRSRYRFPGVDLFRRYERLGNVADLNEAIIEMEKALEACHPGTPDRAGILNIWSVMLVKRFERLGDINDLEKAARISEEIVRKSIAGGQIHIDALCNLGTMLLERFERIGNFEDLQKAIKHTEAALAATPRDHPDHAGRYSNLAVMFSARFERIGDLDDLQKAIKHSEAALAATPRDHPDRAGRY
ncbi:hypothetical protein L873DRAFT_1848275, partial [Choiromyces venosus 120613-1]